METAKTLSRSDAARIREMRRRILSTFDRATAADALEGAAWYSRAMELASALAAGSPLEPIQCAGVIAALSPRCAWGQNVAGAAAMVSAASAGAAEPIVAGTGDNRDKAWRIATGADPADVLGGPKVRRFFRNITGDSDVVTVDVWAARIAEGRENPNAPKGRRYDLIERAYIGAAELRGVTPREMQATTWVAHRRLHGEERDR
jgi:hypothetical protein